MKIIKQLNGNVHITDDSGNIERVMNNQPTILWVNDNNDLHIVQQNDRYENIDVADVSATQILPAAEIAFTGTVQDLLTLLSGSFFFELVGSAFTDYPVGSYQSFSETFGGVSNVAALTNRVYGQVVKVYKEVEVDLISIFIAGAGVVGSAVFGIYKYTDNGTAVGQWDLVEQTDSATPFDTAIGGTQQVLLTNPAILEAGVYCMCTLSSSAFSVTSQNLSTSTTFMGWNIAGGPTSYHNGITNTFTYNATMPAQLTLAAKINLVTTPIITAKVI
jgi:hypothetical protein